jgi:hypothetical protein
MMVPVLSMAMFPGKPGQRHLTFSASKFPLKQHAVKKKITTKSKKSKKKEKTRLCTGTYLTYSTLWLKNLPKLGSFPEHDS